MVKHRNRVLKIILFFIDYDKVLGFFCRLSDFSLPKFYYVSRIKLSNVFVPHTPIYTLNCLSLTLAAAH